MSLTSSQSCLAFPLLPLCAATSIPRSVIATEQVGLYNYDRSSAGCGSREAIAVRHWGDMFPFGSNIQGAGRRRRREQCMGPDRSVVVLVLAKNALFSRIPALKCTIRPSSGRNDEKLFLISRVRPERRPLSPRHSSIRSPPPAFPRNEHFGCD